jgi:excisionase family DNA binding protein
MPRKVPANPPGAAEFVSTREAAQMLGVALRTVQLWVESGSLSAWKTLGGHRRIARVAVDKLVAQQLAAINESGAHSVFRLQIVEDDPLQRRLYEMDVPNWGLPIQLGLARDGFEGLLQAASFRPHMIVADLQMPGMDGFRMIEAIRQDPNILAEIVVVTALPADTISARGGLSPDVRVLQKPVPLTTIREIAMTQIEATRRVGRRPAGDTQRQRVITDDRSRLMDHE